MMLRRRCGVARIDVFLMGERGCGRLVDGIRAISCCWEERRWREMERDDGME